MSLFKRGSIFLLVMVAFSLVATAQQNPGEKPGEKSAEKPGQKPGEKADEKSKDEKSKDEKKPEEKVVQTKHTIKIGGQEIKYTATAGTILLKLEDGTPKASVFTSRTRKTMGVTLQSVR